MLLAILADANSEASCCGGPLWHFHSAHLHVQPIHVYDIVTPPPCPLDHPQCDATGTSVKVEDRYMLENVRGTLSCMQVV